MTNEEAIENIKLIRFNAVITNAKSFKDALDMAIEALSKPELPSNLDEAAEKYENKTNPTCTCEECLIKSFKAGAEWMAGQFQKIDGSLDDWYETNGVEYCYGIRTNESFEVPEGFYIRKK